jgi:hypothetical protein
MLGLVSPMDRPDPTETNRPQAGGGTAPRKRVQTPPPGGLSSLREPIRPRIETRLGRGIVYLER